MGLWANDMFFFSFYIREYELLVRVENVFYGAATEWLAWLTRNLKVKSSNSDLTTLLSP